MVAVASCVPKTPFDVRCNVPEPERMLGFRMVQLIQFVTDYQRQHDKPPSYEEAVRELNFCDRAAVCRVVQGLERRGVMQRVGDGRDRRIRLVINNN